LNRSPSHALHPIQLPAACLVRMRQEFDRSSVRWDFRQRALERSPSPPRRTHLAQSLLAASPARAVCRCTQIAVVPTVLDPFPGIAVDLAKSPWIGLLRTRHSERPLNRRSREANGGLLPSATFDGAVMIDARHSRRRGQITYAETLSSLANRGESRMRAAHAEGKIGSSGSRLRHTLKISARDPAFD
jgi:hypothetical protein